MKEFIYDIDGAHINIVMDGAGNTGRWLLFATVSDGEEVSAMTIEINQDCVPDQIEAIEGMIRGDKNAGLVIATEALVRARTPVTH